MKSDLTFGVRMWSDTRGTPTGGCGGRGGRERTRGKQARLLLDCWVSAGHTPGMSTEGFRNRRVPAREVRLDHFKGVEGVRREETGDLGPEDRARVVLDRRHDWRPRRARAGYACAGPSPRALDGRGGDASEGAGGAGRVGGRRKGGGESGPGRYRELLKEKRVTRTMKNRKDKSKHHHQGDRLLPVLKAPATDEKWLPYTDSRLECHVLALAKCHVLTPGGRRTAKSDERSEDRDDDRRRVRTACEKKETFPVLPIHPRRGPRRGEGTGVAGVWVEGPLRALREAESPSRLRAFTVVRREWGR